MSDLKPKVLFVYADRFCSCTFKRCFEVVNGLNRYYSNQVNVSAINCYNLEESHFKLFQVILFQRLGANGLIINDELKSKLGTWIHKYKSQCKFIYDIDDLVLNCQNYTSLWLLKQCHLALAPNEYLQKELSKHQQCAVIRTHVDLEMIDHVNPRKLEEGFHVGWFSTSANGIDTVKQFIGGLPQEVFIHLFCDSILHGPIREKIPHSNLILHEIVSPIEMYQYMKSMLCLINPLTAHELYKVYSDINVNDRFLESKSEIKYALAGACRVPLVVTPIGSYQSIVQHGINGFFADSTDEWTECLLSLVRNFHLGATVGNTAYQDVNKHYSLQRAAKDYLDLFSLILTSAQNSDYIGLVAQ